MDIKAIRQKRLITAIKTPYNFDGTIDIDSFDRLVDRQIQSGIEGLVICGTTGEGHLMSWEEHLMLIGHTINNFGSKLLIIGNTGSNYTKESYNATIDGFNLGMDAALLINPYYGKTSFEGLKKHFLTTMEIGPSIIYNVPSRTSQDITPELIEIIAKHKNFVAVKECAGSNRISQYYKKQIYCWSGNDDQSYDSYFNHNSLGLISVTANVIPQIMLKLLQSKKSKELNNNLKNFFSWMFSQPSPIPLNSILSDLRLIKPVFRLPYVPLSFKQRKLGLSLLLSFLKDIPTEPLSDDKFILL